MSEEKKDLAPYRKHLEEEWNLPPELQKALIQSQDVISDFALRVALWASRRYLIPLSTLAVIPTKQGPKPYITARGVEFILHHKGDYSVDVEILQWPEESNGYTARAKATAIVNGRKFVDYAQVSLDQELRKNPRANPDDVLHKCVTKAKRRAGLSAVGVPLPLYEEVIEGEYEEIKEIDEEPKPKKLTIPIFLAEVKKLGYSIDEALRALGVQSATQIEDLEQALEELRRKKDADPRGSSRAEEDRRRAEG